MDEKTLKVLEFDKVIDMLKECSASILGKEHIMKLKPCCDFDVVSKWQRETTDGVDFVLKLGVPNLGGIKDIRNAIKRLKINGVLNCKELLDIADILRVSRLLKVYLDKDKNKIPNNILLSMIESLYVNNRIEESISKAILNEEELNDNASNELLSIRKQISSQKIFIKNKLNELVKSPVYTKYMRDAIVTIRDDRYVIPIKQEYRSEVSGLVHDSSSSGATLFIEPMVVVDANNKIKQLRVKEKIEIEKILLELSNSVKVIMNELGDNIKELGMIDFIFAKANFSLKYDCVSPTLVWQKEICIKNGRHILLDKNTVRPIDFWLGKDFKTLLITGPNTGGKTVTLKTVGLFSLMTQAGLHVPASSGTIMPVFDNVYADIGDEQSIEQSLSTFSSHIKNIINIINNVNDNSLVLLDEIGAGTDPTEGAALAMSILNHFRKIGVNVVATTHYSELKIYASMTDGVENASCEFDVSTLRPTYKLLIGVPGRSNAFSISKKLGMLDSIINDAYELLTKEQIKFEDMLQQIEKNIQQTEAEKNKVVSYRMEIENLRRKIKIQEERLRDQKDQILKEAKIGAKKILEKAKADASNIIDEIRKAASMKEESEKNKEIEKNRLKLKGKIDSIDKSLEEKLLKTVTPKDGRAKLKIKDIKAGDTVYIANLDKKGDVLSINDKTNEVLVLVGILKLNVHISNLRKLDEKKSYVTSIGTRKTKDISTKIDVRGNTLEEAIYLVDKYLDDVSLSNISNITIVHGKGSGVLREGIKNFLKHNCHVKSFRAGNFGEGELGVTIVELKK